MLSPTHTPTSDRRAARRAFAAAALALLTTAAVSPLSAQRSRSAADSAAYARARADSVHRPYTAADIEFVDGMLHHHAQAVLMAGWAASHNASPDVRTLCDRIINAQRDEITLMSQWLRDRRLPVPVPDPHGMHMNMGGTEHTMLMPGMLSEAELAQLDSARGQDFDLLFLKGMIKHHQGAVSMVKKLFGTPGGGQDETIFKLASDINVDQRTEIARMQKMLIAKSFGS